MDGIQDGGTPLHEAASQSKLDSVRTLVNSLGADLDASDNVSIMIVFDHGMKTKNSKRPFGSLTGR